MEHCFLESRFQYKRTLKTNSGNAPNSMAMRMIAMGEGGRGVGVRKRSSAVHQKVARGRGLEVESGKRGRGVETDIAGAEVVKGRGGDREVETGTAAGGSMV